MNMVCLIFLNYFFSILTPTIGTHTMTGKNGSELNVTNNFRDDENIEWYDSWTEISKNIPLKINPDSKVLHIGCGSSTLGIDLFNSGIESVINADFSESCINLMRAKYPHLTYILLDALDIGKNFSENFFDLIIDKGCLDSILCHENYREKVQKVLENFYTCLKDEGYLIVISGGNSEERLMYFNVCVF
eukprot:XP_763833.1 hypothetical protein [Theileria parva strain Muguga]